MGHDRLAFSCGIEALDTYLHRQAGQDARRRVTAPFVLVYGSNPTVIGYYTLSQMRIHLGDLPPNIVKKLPKYPAIPVTLLGRLAVNGRYRGLGLGEFLLLDALWRSWTLSSEIAAFAVVVDAKDDSSIAFYEHYEFQAFPEHPQRLFITMAKLEKLFTR
jgi:GNAT superfamily N-acetyltransferase